MKKIGLLGGMSRISTVSYYSVINRAVNKILGKQHSARMVIQSIDYETIKKYNYKNRDNISNIILKELKNLAGYEPDCILIGCNTVHKAYDMIKHDLNISIPIFHIVECISESVLFNGGKKCLLLGTKFVMEDGFYSENLRKNGLEVIIPDAHERKEIHRIIQQELSNNDIKHISRERLLDLIKRTDCDSVILGCTELSLILSQKYCEKDIYDCIQVHCNKAINFSLENQKL